MRVLIRIQLIVAILLSACFSSTTLFADTEATITMTARAGEICELNTWVKRMSAGQTQPEQGADYPFDNLDFGTLVWEDGRCKAPSGRWYAIFLAMNSNNANGYNLTVETTGMDNGSGGNISDSIMLTGDFQEADKYSSSDDDAYVESEETVLRSSMNAGSNYAEYIAATRSLDKIINQEANQFQIYNTTKPKNRIVRCYVSVFNYHAENAGPDANQMDQIGTALTAAAPGAYSGSITFTMTTN